MTITAKYNGRCKSCGGFISAGESIEWTKADGARHSDCNSTSTQQTEIQSSGVEEHGRYYHRGRRVWDRDSPGSGLTSDELLERTQRGQLSWSNAMNTDF